ncbi:hypothetical protein H6P81_018069 [Aristolochia fimbriata]|uniref:DUF4283 domain-containing protein n=1 Tax=Aristolochia fimbriata TaxID=158543 RepID=A0AAV7DZY7_ARIFI|nr:hypothetical protein H6P81_018069 [Aristolochia fimbriata]
MAFESDSGGEGTTSLKVQSLALKVREELSEASGKKHTRNEGSDEQQWQEVCKGIRRKGGRALKLKFFRFRESTLQIDKTRDFQNGKPYKGLKLMTMKEGGGTSGRELWSEGTQFLLGLNGTRRPICRIAQIRAGRILARIPFPLCAEDFGWAEIRGAMEFVLGWPSKDKEKAWEPPQPLLVNLPSARNLLKEEILFSHAAWDKGAAALRRCVVLKSEGEWEAFRLVLENINKWWPLSSEPRLSFLAQSTWLVWIEDEVEQAQVLAKGREASMKCYPYEKWRQWSGMATWVRMTGLPLELWSPPFLESIFREIGELLRLDEATVTTRRMDYARALIPLKYPIEAEVHRIARVGTQTFTLSFTGEKSGAQVGDDEPEGEDNTTESNSVSNTDFVTEPDFRPRVEWLTESTELQSESTRSMPSLNRWQGGVCSKQLQSPSLKTPRRISPPPHLHPPHDPTPLHHLAHFLLPRPPSQSTRSPQSTLLTTIHPHPCPLKAPTNSLSHQRLGITSHPSPNTPSKPESHLHNKKFHPGSPPAPLEVWHRLIENRGWVVVLFHSALENMWTPRPEERMEGRVGHEDANFMAGNGGRKKRVIQ